MYYTYQCKHNNFQVGTQHMDFRNRGVQPHATMPAGRPTASVAPAAPSMQHTGPHAKHVVTGPAKWLQLSSVVLLFSITALLLSLAALLYSGKSGLAHSVMKDKYQAVFLDNGQVYFGHIGEVGSNHLNLTTIYYLQTSTTDTSATNPNVSLVKLGCELHGPYDRMIINNEHVLFWENLQDSSQVVKAIANYAKQNPNGQQCSAQSQTSTNQAPTTTSPQATTTNPATKKP